MARIITEQQISRAQAQLRGLRPKILPLAFVATIIGTALTWWQDHLDPLITLLTLITTGLLQILPDLVSDYGDTVEGSDKPDRVGLLRGIQRGAIAQQEMKQTLIITVVLICLSGLALVAVTRHTLADFAGFLTPGGLPIIVATTCIVGNHPYGYIGLDDVSVPVFFGWLSITGSQYLQTHTLVPAPIPPATACDLLATAVLNINNLRDISSDRGNGKNTLAVRLGEVNAHCYHACLSMGPLVCLAPFNLFLLYSLWGRLSLLAIPSLVKQACYMMQEMDLVAIRPAPEHAVKGALPINLLFVLGILLSQWVTQLTSIN